MLPPQMKISHPSLHLLGGRGWGLAAVWLAVSLKGCRENKQYVCLFLNYRARKNSRGGGAVGAWGGTDIILHKW